MEIIEILLKIILYFTGVIFSVWIPGMILYSLSGVYKVDKKLDAWWFWLEYSLGAFVLLVPIAVSESSKRSKK